MIYCKYKIFIAIVFAASFILIIYYTNELIFTLIVIAFLFCGIFSFKLYFRFYPKDNFAIRINKKYKYKAIGSIKGRKVYLTGNTHKLEEGQRISARGEFKKEIIYEKGIIGTYYISRYDKLQDDLLCKISKFKYRVQREMEMHLGEDVSGIVTSLCFGTSDAMGENDKLDLQKLGVIHVISVSGFHLAIIYKIAEVILGVTGGIIVSFIYTLFIGMKYSTIRAFIMIFILKLSKILYKNYDSLSALSMAFIIIIFLKPYAFMGVGFMLSFLATLGIILFFKPTSKFLIFMSDKLRNCIAISLSSQIFILPYLAYTLKEFSLGFLLGNIFLIPIYSLIIIIGNLSVLFIRVTFLFKILICLIICLCRALDGANYILLKVCPPLMYLNEDQGIFIIIIYISCIMMKKGMKNYIYAPVIIFIFLMKNYYVIFPEIYAVNYNKLTYVMVNYKTKRIMVCNDKLITKSCFENLKDQYNIINNYNNNVKLNLNKDFYINIRSEYGEIKNILIVDNRKHNYDIIYLSENNFKRYKVIFGKALKWR